MKNVYRLPTQTWTTERMVFLLAGFFVLVSVLLGVLHTSNWFYFTGFVGVMMIFFALTGWCPMAIFVQKFCSTKSLSELKKE